MFILYIEQRKCNSERRLRCVASVSHIKRFFDRAKAKGVAVVYSLTSRGTPETILPAEAPVGNEPIVKSSVDKFLHEEGNVGSKTIYTGAFLEKVDRSSL